jgi:uncharacterized protein YbbC (DUF1343 family)
MAEDRGPTVEMLKEIDALVYDLPEVGRRTWTYVSTMALSMQAAARKEGRAGEPSRWNTLRALRVLHWASAF